MAAMVAHYGIGIPKVRTQRHPGDLRWPARRVVAGMALYVALAWAGVSLLVLLAV